MACPYFLPAERVTEEWWPHRRRLPLGDGWRGCCAARPGYHPGDEELREFCNLGYAAGCAHLPAERRADAVRFGVNAVDGRLRVLFVCERNYVPGSSGVIEFDAATRACLTPHPHACLQRLAECCLETWIAKRRR